VFTLFVMLFIGFRLEGLEAAVRIAAGDEHTLVLTKSGKVYVFKVSLECFIPPGCDLCCACLFERSRANLYMLCPAGLALVATALVKSE